MKKRMVEVRISGANVWICCVCDAYYSFSRSSRHEYMNLEQRRKNALGMIFKATD